jgi:hypothetical protein
MFPKKHCSLGFLERCQSKLSAGHCPVLRQLYA